MLYEQGVINHYHNSRLHDGVDHQSKNCISQLHQPIVLDDDNVYDENSLFEMLSKVRQRISQKIKLLILVECSSDNPYLALLVQAIKSYAKAFKERLGFYFDESIAHICYPLFVLSTDHQNISVFFERHQAWKWNGTSVRLRQVN
jgi:hypothetical protein